MFTSQEDYIKYLTQKGSFEDCADKAKERYSLTMYNGYKKLEPLIDEIEENEFRCEEFQNQMQAYDKSHRLDFEHASENLLTFRGSVPACSRGCCGTTTLTIEMPAECLWNMEYGEPGNIEEIAEAEIEVLRKEYQTKIEDKKAKEQKEEAEQQLLLETQDKEEWERLKQKFGH